MEIVPSTTSSRWWIAPVVYGLPRHGIRYRQSAPPTTTLSPRMKQKLNPSSETTQSTLPCWFSVNSTPTTDTDADRAIADRRCHRSQADRARSCRWSRCGRRRRHRARRRHRVLRAIGRHRPVSPTPPSALFEGLARNLEIPGHIHHGGAFVRPGLEETRQRATDPASIDHVRGLV